MASTCSGELEESLAELQTVIDRIPDPDPPPKTTLQVQQIADAEGAWQHYLCHFLDPTARHGMGTDALTRFLTGLDAATDDDVPTRVSDDVLVESEMASERGNRPDLVVREPGEFFVCCELKLYSGEGDDQTKRYVADEDIGGVPKGDTPEGGHHYVYIKRPGQPDPSADEFESVTWADVRAWFEPLLLDHRGRYPTRTTAQLADFLDTIQRDMTDDEHIAAEREKMHAYFDYESAIDEAVSAVETVHEYERQNWRRRFLSDYRPETWTDEWQCNSNVWGQIYHEEWRRDESLEIEDAEVSLHFVHLIRDLESFQEGKLTLQLRWPGDSPYRERFKELVASEAFADDLDPLLAAHDIEKRLDYSKANPRFTEKEYSVAKSRLPESYYETLRQAVSEHQPLAPVIIEILDEAIDRVEN